MQIYFNSFLIIWHLLIDIFEVLYILVDFVDRVQVLKLSAFLFNLDYNHFKSRLDELSLLQLLKKRKEKYA